MWIQDLLEQENARRSLTFAVFGVRFAPGGDTMTTNDIAKKYVALCKEHKNDTCLDELFAANAVSVEAAAMPGMDRTSNGLDAIRAKGKLWMENHIVHSAEVTGPYPHDDRFAVRFTYEVTNKPSGKRMSMDEVGLFTVENGKITREEFFYPTGG
jgi:ketosteroid isomerase-like protein